MPGGDLYRLVILSLSKDGRRIAEGWLKDSRKMTKGFSESGSLCHIRQNLSPLINLQ